jgi:anti-sigma factor RsiW
MTHEHDIDWDGRLQDWLDGELAPDDAAAVAAHVDTCSSCREYAAALRALDTSLQSAVPKLALDERFDRHLLERIVADDEARRAAARARVQAQIEAELAEFGRNWRRRFLALIPSVLAGIAIAFACAMYFDTAEWVRSLLGTDSGIDSLYVSYLHALMTSAVGAAIGYTVARWLTTESTG